MDPTPNAELFERSRLRKEGRPLPATRREAERVVSREPPPAQPDYVRNAIREGTLVREDFPVSEHMDDIFQHVADTTFREIGPQDADALRAKEAGEQYVDPRQVLSEEKHGPALREARELEQRIRAQTGPVEAESRKEREAELDYIAAARADEERRGVPLALRTQYPGVKPLPPQGDELLSPLPQDDVQIERIRRQMSRKAEPVDAGEPAQVGRGLTAESVSRRVTHVPEPPAQE